MSLSRTVSEINGDFSRKLQISPTPVYMALPMKGFSLELGNGARGQKSRMMGDRADKEVWRYPPPSGTNVTDGQTDRQTDGRTDGRTDTRQQQRPRLRIASRGKNCSHRWLSYNWPALQDGSVQKQNRDAFIMDNDLLFSFFELQSILYLRVF